MRLMATLNGDFSFLTQKIQLNKPKWAPFPWVLFHPRHSNQNSRVPCTQIRKSVR